MYMLGGTSTHTLVGEDNVQHMLLGVKCKLREGMIVNQMMMGKYLVGVIKMKGRM
jgi:hypothetical protein